MMTDSDDIIRLKEQNRDLKVRLEKYTDEIRFYRELGRAMSSTLDMHELLDLVADWTRKLINADLVVIPLINNDKQEYYYAAASGEGTENIVGVSFALNVGMCGWVLTHKQTLVFAEGHEFLMEKKTVWEEGHQSALLVPLIGKNGIIGGLSGLGKKDGKCFSQDDIDALTLFANTVSPAIENAELFNKINQMVNTLEQQVAHRTQALQESETRFRTVADYAYDWEYWLSPSGHLLYVSPSCERISGYRADEFMQDAELLVKISHPDDRVRVAAHLHETTAAVAIHQQDFRIITRSGEERWIAHLCRSIFDNEGIYQGRRASNRDITDRKLTEETLRVEKEKYYSLVRNIQAGIIVHAADSSILISNVAAETMLGLSEDQMRGKVAIDPVWHFFREDGSVMPIEEYPVSQVLRTRYPLRNFVIGVHRSDNKSDIWVLVNADPIFDEVNNLLQIVITFIDITARKQAEEALQKTQDSLNEAQRIAQIGNWELNLLDNSLFWSDEIFHIFEIDKARFDATYQAFLSVIHPEDRDAVNAAYTHSLEKREPYSITHRLLMPDGRIKQVHEQCETHYNSEGKAIRSVGTVQDITAREEVLAKLQASELRFRSYFELPLIGIAITSLEKGWLNVNQCLCDIFGYPREELVKLTWVEITYPEDLPKDVAEFERLLAGEIDGYSLDKRFIRKDGVVIYASIAVRCVRKSDGSPDYFVALVQDIDARKQAEAELERYRHHLETLVEERTSELLKAKDAAEAANRAKSTFIANMSHELRTPLSAIMGFSELMAQDDTLSAKQKENLLTIHRSGWHLLTVINDILEISKIETGRLELNNQAFDLHKLLHDIGDIIKVPAENKRLNFSLEISPDVPQYVKTDSGKFRQILLNLLDNALKFTTQGQIILRSHALPLATAGRVMLEIAVIDSGSGIATDKLNDLFKPFVQLARRDSGLEGTGLGLATCKSLIELMSGEMSVSTVQSVGSTFKIELPVSTANAADVAVKTDLKEVDFIYPEPFAFTPSVELELTPEMLNALPLELRQQLHETASNLDIDETDAVIAKIRNLTPDIADGLQKLAQNYQFEQLAFLSKRDGYDKSFIQY